MFQGLIPRDPHSLARHLGLLTALRCWSPVGAGQLAWAGTAPDAVPPRGAKARPQSQQHTTAALRDMSQVMAQTDKRWKTSQNGEAERGRLETGVTAESGAAQCLFGWGVRLLT
ncbi:unnamed protein product [Boreogadus saida]